MVSYQFRKKFTFHSKREYSPNNIPFSTNERDRESLSPRPPNAPADTRDPSPSSIPLPSHDSPSLSRLTVSSDVYAQASRGADALSQDPLGLKVVYRPQGDRRADIIFVHGLGGSSRMTWSKNHNLEFFWPLKFLPLEPDIDEARILTFGYNANFRRGSGKNRFSVLDFAKDLLYDLKYAKDESVPELEDLKIGEASVVRSFDLRYG